MGVLYSTTRRKRVTAGSQVEVWEYHDGGLREGVVPERAEEKGDRVKREDAVWRAKRMVRWLVQANAERELSIFFTTTFSEDVRSYDDAVAAWSRFRRRLREEWPEASYVVVPELQLRGVWHFHAVLFGCPSLTELKTRYGRRTRRDGRSSWAWKWRLTVLWSLANGHDAERGEVDRAEAQVVRSPGALSRYVTKYLTKETGQAVPADARMYFAGGKGLHRPKIERVPVVDVTTSSVMLTECCVAQPQQCRCWQGVRGSLLATHTLESAARILGSPQQLPTFAFSKRKPYAGRVTYWRYQHVVPDCGKVPT